MRIACTAGIYRKGQLQASLITNFSGVTLWALILISFGNGIIVHADEDNSIGYYAQKSVKAVKECIKERNLPLEFIQAWH